MSVVQSSCSSVTAGSRYGEVKLKKCPCIQAHRYAQKIERKIELLQPFCRLTWQLER
jgi:hypothetical protein